LVVVMMTVFSLRTFAPAWLMTSGGPRGTTNFVVHHIYVMAFQMQRPGSASAISVALMLVAFAISGMQMLLLCTRWRHA
jgi:ABC-type sugar transport system permease subunit